MTNAHDARSASTCPASSKDLNVSVNCLARGWAYSGEVQLNPKALGMGRSDVMTCRTRLATLESCDCDDGPWGNTKLIQNGLSTMLAPCTACRIARASTVIGTVSKQTHEMESQVAGFRANVRRRVSWNLARDARLVSYCSSVGVADSVPNGYGYWPS